MKAYLPAKIEAVTRELEDPELYTRPNGVARAKVLGGQLDELKPALERALEEWGSSTETLDTLTAGRA